MGDIITGVCVIVPVNNAGIVTYKSGKYYCVTCHKNFCEHAKAVTNNESEVTQQAEVLIQLKELCYSSTCQTRPAHVLSKIRIPFEVNDHISSALNGLSGIASIVCLPKTPFVPDCQCGINMYATAYKDCDVITRTCVTKLKGLNILP